MAETKMKKIEVKIIKNESVNWKELKPFQPKNLKTLSKVSYEKLKNSLIHKKFLDPFNVWQNKDGTWILDGHHRQLILLDLEKEGYEVPEKLPCNFVDCKDKKEANELVLIYSSSYNRIDNEGLGEFIYTEGLDIAELTTFTDLPGIDLLDLQLEIPEIPEESNNDQNFEVVVTCQDELDQDAIFNLMTSKGYKCRK